MLVSSVSHIANNDNQCGGNVQIIYAPENN